MNGYAIPVIVEFPLRGEWMAPNTPGKRIPSHGTDQLGERYAFDFVKVDPSRKGKPFYRASPLRYLLYGVPLHETYGWGEGVYAPCDGEIVAAEDGRRERARVHPVSDLFVALKNAYAFRPDRDRIDAVAGNYIVMKCRENVFAGFAHLKTGSVAVAAGQCVTKGQKLGEVGHSGNSTAPHLHFQLMDRSDLRTAKGIPCAFERYERFRGGEWKVVRQGIPSDQDRIRFQEVSTKR